MGFPRGLPLGRGHGARSPMRDVAPLGGLSRRKGQAALRSRRKRVGNPWREGAGVRAAREREGGSLAAEVPRRVGSTEREEPPAAALRSPGVGRYAMDSANEPSLLMWCLSRALPALTTIMSMPSKRTGTSPSGV